MRDDFEAPGGGGGGGEGGGGPGGGGGAETKNMMSGGVGSSGARIDQPSQSAAAATATAPVIEIERHISASSRWLGFSNRHMTSSGTPSKSRNTICAATSADLRRSRSASIWHSQRSDSISERLASRTTGSMRQV